MMAHILTACFEELGLHRVQTFVDKENEAAVAFYRKMGFHEDGLMREAQKAGDRFVDWHCMSMLDREWAK